MGPEYADIVLGLIDSAIQAAKMRGEMGRLVRLHTTRAQFLTMMDWEEEDEEDE